MADISKINHKVNISGGKSEKAGIASENQMKRAILDTLKYEKVNISCTVNIKISNDEEIRDYNRKYRDTDKPTDVLSFPMQEFKGAGWENIDNPEPDIDTSDIPLGDIILSAETTKRQAAEYNNKAEYETAYLLIHSALHLLGYDHDSPENEEVMHNKIKAIINETECNAK